MYEVGGWVYEPTLIEKVKGQEGVVRNIWREFHSYCSKDHRISKDTLFEVLRKEKSVERYSNTWKLSIEVLSKEREVKQF